MWIPNIDCVVNWDDSWLVGASVIVISLCILLLGGYSLFCGSRVFHKNVLELL